MPKVKRTEWSVFEEATFGLHCAVCGSDKKVRVPVLTVQGVGIIEKCFTCSPRKTCSSD